MDREDAIVVVRSMLADIQATVETTGNIAIGNDDHDGHIAQKHRLDELSTFLDGLQARQLSIQEDPDATADTTANLLNDDETRNLELLQIGHPDAMRVECIACLQRPLASNALEISCEPDHHVYCRQCIEGMFRNATRDESMFPPSCCRPIDIDAVRTLLPQDLVEAFLEKSVEFTTKDRIYCFQADCTTFIHPEHVVANVATCQRCGARTCSICKNESHVRECPDDPEAQIAINTIRANGWSLCPGCGAGIELHHGCNHMTCVCGHQFCYICEAEWRTCECPQFIEEQLLAPENRLQVLQHRRAVQPECPQCVGRRLSRIDTRALRNQNLGRTHCQRQDCTSEPRYLYRCGACGLLRCGRCRHLA